MTAGSAPGSESSAGPRRLSSGAFAALAAQVVAIGATTATSVAIARLLGPLEAVVAVGRV